VSYVAACRETFVIAAASAADDGGGGLTN